MRTESIDLSTLIEHIKIRADFEKADLATLHRSTDVSCNFEDISNRAYEQGIADFRKDENVLTGMLEPVHLLSESWSDGYHFAAHDREMNFCICCIEANGDPCQIHG